MYVHVLVLILAAVAALLLGAVLARSALRHHLARERSANSSTMGTLDKLRLQLVETKAELNDVRDRWAAETAELRRECDALEVSRDALQTKLSTRPTNVRDLLPARMDRVDTSSEASQFCRLAFRSHVMFSNECPVVLSFRDIVTAPVGQTERHAMLCELYSRAVFECAFARLFDGADPCTDVVVLEQVSDAMGAQCAYDVHLTVKSRGVVLREPPTMDGNGATPAASAKKAD